MSAAQPSTSGVPSGSNTTHSRRAAPDTTKRTAPAQSSTTTTSNSSSTQRSSGSLPPANSAVRAPSSSKTSVSATSSAMPIRKPLSTSTSAAQPASAGSRKNNPPPRTNPTSNTQPSHSDLSKIPFHVDDKEHAEHRECYVELVKLVANRRPENKPRIVVFTDIEQDYDDLLAIIFLAEMHRMGAVELAGFVANHNPALQRAKFLRTVLHLLGLPNMPVAVGTDGREHPEQHNTDFYYGLKNKTFENMDWNKPKTLDGGEKKEVFESGASLIKRLTGPGKRRLTVLLISTLQDIGELFDAHKKTPNYLRNNFCKFVSQGGYSVTEKEVEAEASKAATPPKSQAAAPSKTKAATPSKAVAAAPSKAKATKQEKPKKVLVMTPDMDMTNNKFHPTQAANYTNTLARLRLPSDAWSREAAKAARLPGTFMEELFKYGPIGAHLRWLWKRQEFKFYWDPFNWPYMKALNIGWYLNTRLGLSRESEEFAKLEKSGLSFTAAAPMVKVIAYDCCAAVGAVGDDFMRKMGVLEKKLPAYNTAYHRHRVFGKKVGDLGGINIPRLAKVMEAFLLGGLMATHDKKNAGNRDGFKTLSYQYATSPFELGFFLSKMLPVMKSIADHEAEARKHRKDAAEALKAAGKGEHDRLIGLADHQVKLAESRKKELGQLTGRSMDKLPNRDDIPYEQLYQDAMKKAAEAAKKRKEAEEAKKKAQGTVKKELQGAAKRVASSSS